KAPNLEIHSSVGTILFCYGIIGLFLAGRFVLLIVRGAGWRMGLMLLPVLLHQLAHQGLRFSLMWVTLALFLLINELARAARARGQPRPTRTVLMTSPSRM